MDKSTIVNAFTENMQELLENSLNFGTIFVDFAVKISEQILI